MQQDDLSEASAEAIFPTKWHPGTSLWSFLPLACVPSKNASPSQQTLAGTIAAAILLAASFSAAAASPADLQKEVADTERAFAKTMADRDHAAFASFLSPDAVFFSRASVLHGKEEVAAAWKRFYDGAAAPFSWEPDQVEVLASGDLALSTGPVHDPQGKLIGRFNSI